MSKKESDIADALKRAIYAHGTARILEKKQRKLALLRDINTLMGFIVPLGVGTVVLTVGIKELLMPKILIAAGIFSFSQLMVSLWLLIRNWNDKHDKYSKSKQKNYEYADDFIEIYIRYNDDEIKYSELLEKLKAKDAEQRKKDHDILDKLSEKEKNYGKKEAIAQYSQYLQCPKKNEPIGGDHD
jgi:mobilome CxxCx(11)CxxC protein